MEKALRKAIEGGWRPWDSLNHTRMEIPKEIEDCPSIECIDFIFERFGHGGKDHAMQLYSKILMDSLFWQALGKAEHWGRLHCTNCGEFVIPVRKKEDDPEYWKDCCRRKHLDYGVSDKIHYLEFMEYIWNGGDIDSFFNNLLK